jgi:putative PEP-CTERM system TPR-repeat lipoprotein
VERHLERARTAVADGNREAAVIEYRNVLQRDPNHVEAHYELALSLLELGRGKEAFWELRESVRLAPENLDARLHFAWLALASQNPDEALEQASAILERDPDHREARIVRSTGLLQQGELDESAAEAEAILERWPDEQRAYYNLAHVRTAQGRNDEAELHLLRYRELDGGSLIATREVLRFYAATGRADRARALLRSAISQAPPGDRGELALALASSLEQEERLGEAEPYLRVALAADGSRIDVRERLAILLLRDDRLDEAIALLREARAAGAPEIETHRALGDLLMSAERFEEALAEFRAGLRIDASLVPLRLREAEALLRLGRLEASGERLAALLAEHPDEPMLALAQLRSLALASRTDEAIEGLRDLLAREPELTAAHFVLGVLQLAAGRPAEAVRSLGIASERMKGAEGREALRLLAEAELRAGEPASALAHAEKALAEDAGDLRARVLLAQALLESGDATRAVTVLREAPEESASVHGVLARVYVRDGRLERAQASVERAIALEPESVQWAVDLVYVLMEREQLEEALEVARARAAEHPTLPDYPNLMGQVLARRGDEEGARAAFQHAVALDPSFVAALVNLARMSARAQRFGEARELLRRALEQRPEDPTALRTLGLLEHRAGNASAAVEALEAALRAEPGNDLTRADLARARALAGSNLEQALDMARAIRQSEPDNPNYAEALGVVLLRFGVPKAAAEQFRAAIELAPHPIASYHHQLALALLASGNRDGAAREFERALDVDPSFAESDAARARLVELRAPPAG